MERNTPDNYRKLYNQRKTSRKSAVRSFCLECVEYEPSEVRLCVDKDCPLYKWRLKG
jgi:hypothetical protein